MESKLVSKYNSLANLLNEMREEYKLMPSKFLLKKIELADSKLKQIDSIISTSSSSNKDVSLNENTNFSL